MGTSGAYGGSPGMNRVRDQTQQWLETGGGAGGGGDGPTDPTIPAPPPPDAPQPRPIPATSSITPALAGIIATLGRALTSGGGAGGGGGGLSGGGGRSTSRASAAGGRALGGAYGARTGNAAAVGELGLDLGQLAGLTRYQQAQRILDAAMGPRGDVLDSELRKANAAVVLWALTEEVEPTPADMANRWVVEYVWEMWITESGPALQERSGDGYDRLRAEQEMRAALEATVSAHELPGDRPLTSADFTAAIEGALSSLRRISGNAA
jgi:hypothetical protein